MSVITLENIHTSGQVFTPPRLLIYGAPGLGKSSLAAEFPSPIFLQTNDELPPHIEVATFGRLRSYADILRAIDVLYSGEHQFKTVVVDHMADLEMMLWHHLCTERGWKSIEAPGFGRGYVEAVRLWQELLAALDALRDRRAMSVILLGHVEITTVPNPGGAEYPRYDLLLHKRARPVIVAPLDACLFVSHGMSTDDKGSGHVVATGGPQRWIYTEGRPELMAKNRYQMPSRMLYKQGEGFEELKKYFKKEKK